MTPTRQFISEDGRGAEAGLETTQSQWRDHSHPAVSTTKKASGSIRLNFIISSADLGFEAVYHQLSQLSSAEDRSRHVKRLLNQICAGTPLLAATAQPGEIPTRLHNHKIIFRLSGRDVGLEKLYRELLPLSSTFERNQHVRRWLFDASVGSLAKPVKTASPSGSSSNHKPLATTYPVAATLPAPRAETSDAKRKAARQQAMSALGH